jgi:hypothetical protein
LSIAQEDVPQSLPRLHPVTTMRLSSAQEDVPQSLLLVSARMLSSAQEGDHLRHLVTNLLVEKLLSKEQSIRKLSQRRSPRK